MKIKLIQRVNIKLASAFLMLFWVLSLSVPQTYAAPSFNHPTYSSPIALSIDNKLVWSVNPKDNSVSVIRTDTNKLVKTIPVGNEPQSIALTPNNRWAYVANAAAGTLWAIKILNANPDAFDARLERKQISGAEPWNVVVSPDGKRVFVANSGQDTITVINTRTRQRLGIINLRGSLCSPNKKLHFQPRGLAVTQDNSRLFVTGFFAFIKDGGRQGDDNGKEGLVCRLDIDTASADINDYSPAQLIRLGSRVTGFKAKIGDNDVDTSAFPNQLQSIVIRGDNAYLPNIAASPSGPLKFNVDTQAFVNIIGGINSDQQTDASFINLHLGARTPEQGKKKLFFANPWAIAFTNQSGAGTAYAVSAGSDLLVKTNVNADGSLSNTGGDTTTRYIDLNDPANPLTSGDKAGKNPLGIAITDDGKRAYVMNFVSRTVSVVNLETDAVVDSIRTVALPPPGSPAERVLVGAEIFFSSRGHFDKPAGTDANFSVDERLSSDGWQNCASCHFQGWTDGIVWTFNTGPRKSVPLNGTFNPRDRNDQRVLNYSAIFDEVEDFELNIRNVSGPGAVAAPVPCSAGAANSTFDIKHGLLLGDADNNLPPCTIVGLPNKANAGRPQLTVTLPGSNTPIPALTAMKEWVQFAVRTPNGPIDTGRWDQGVSQQRIAEGRALFQEAGCVNCHNGGKWTASSKNFTSPPTAAQIAAEVAPINTTPFLAAFLRDIGSFNLNVDDGNKIPNFPLIGGVEKDQAGATALGNGDKGKGFNIPSLLGIFALPPYYHNGACESLACVVADVKHRTANGTLPDKLDTAQKRGRVVRFLESINAKTEPF